MMKGMFVNVLTPPANIDGHERKGPQWTDTLLSLFVLCSHSLSVVKLSLAGFCLFKH